MSDNVESKYNTCINYCNTETVKPNVNSMY